MRRYQLSPEFETYRRTLRCPNGHRHALTFVEGGGPMVQSLRWRDRLMLENPLPRFEEQLASLEVVDRLRRANHDRGGGLAIRAFRRDSSFACATCGDHWPVFAQRDVEVLSHRPTRRSLTDLGVDERRLDQRGAAADSSITLDFAQEWTTRLEVGWERLAATERTSSAGVKGSWGPVDLSAGTRHRVTERLTSTHALTSETRRTARQTIECVLPARTVTVIRLFWKQCWQHFECDLLVPGSEARLSVPYRVAVDVTFDHEIRHLPA
jgi:hypothetical protein